MVEISALVLRIATSELNVIVHGETGLDAIARAIHARSARRDAPLIACACGALAELPALPDRGTVLLDDVDALAPALQARLAHATTRARFLSTTRVELRVHLRHDLYYRLDGITLVVPPVDERARIVAALARCAGNQTRAAKLLGMSRATLATRLALLDIPRPRK